MKEHIYDKCNKCAVEPCCSSICNGFISFALEKMLITISKSFSLKEAETAIDTVNRSNLMKCGADVTISKNKHDNAAYVFSKTNILR